MKIYLICIVNLCMCTCVHLTLPPSLGNLAYYIYYIWPGVLWFMGSQRVRHNWATELNWTERSLNNKCCSGKIYSEMSPSLHWYGLPQWLNSKESICNAGDEGLIPRLGRSIGEGNGNPFQYSGLWNPMDRAAWWATVCGIAKIVTKLSG